MSDGSVENGLRAKTFTKRLRVRILAPALALGLTGCGLTYTSPAVREGDEGVPVEVIELTVQSVAEANMATYTPRSLPEVFYSLAGGGSLVGAGALPGMPYIPDERRVQVEYRALPDTDPTPYRIGVGDVLLLATRGSASTIEQLSGLLAAQNQRQGYTVRDDGSIAIPEVGTVELSGMTVEQAENKLFNVLVENQIDPSFSLEVAEFNSQRVAVGGAVRSSALVPITLTPLTLGDALTTVGGIAVKDEEFAAIRIYRDGSLYQIPLETYLAKPELQKKILQNGDAIYVDTTYDLDRALEFYKQKLDVISLRSSTRTNSLQTLVTEVSLQREALEERRRNFEARVEFDAEARDYVYLAGEVKKQSRFPLPYNRQATLADALYDEGGFDNTTGNPAEIYVLRASSGNGEAGVIKAYHLNGKNIANIVLATRLQMRPNDVIFIEEQPITKWGRALQQLFPALLRSASGSL